MKSPLNAAALATALAIGACAPLGARAAYYTATGVQNDVAIDTVINGGWEVIFRGSYSDNFSLTQVLATTYDYTNVMVASLHVASDPLDVLAYATKAEITRETAVN